MSVSTKELFTAFFKGLAFAKGLNFGDKNRGMAEDRWITIHPGGNPEDARRVEIDDYTGEIKKGLATALIGTNIKDISKKFKDKEKVEGKKVKDTNEFKRKEESLKDRINKVKELIKTGQFAEAEKLSKEFIKKHYKNKDREFYDIDTHHENELNKLYDLGEKAEKDRKYYENEKQLEENYKKEQEEKAERKARNDKEANEYLDNLREKYPIKDKKMQKMVDIFNMETTEKFKELKEDTDKSLKEFKDKEKKILEDIEGKRIEYLSDNELKDLLDRVTKTEDKINDTVFKVRDFSKVQRNLFERIVGESSGLSNTYRTSHYLENLKSGDELGDFALNDGIETQYITTKTGANLGEVLRTEMYYRKEFK